MFYGVRDNDKSFYFGEFLTQFFARQGSGSHLYVACSRGMVNVPSHQNVTFESGRLQRSLSRFCLQKFIRTELPATFEPIPDANTHILICGNRNALQKSVFESLLMSETTKKQLQASGRLLMELWSE